MSKQTYNNQTITEYLLGSLPETETERFDELSITNDEFAETLKAAEKDLVDAYVQGELTGAALIQFKSHYLASPLRREKVEFAQAFQTLITNNLAAQAEVPEGNPVEPETKKGLGLFSAGNAFTVPRLAWQWGFAAAALTFFLAGGWLALENVRLHRQMTQTEARREALGLREQELQREIEGSRSNNAKTEQELARVTEERKSLEDELKKEQDRERVDEQQQPSRQTEGLIVSFILAPQMRGIGQVPTVSVPAETEYVAMKLDMESNDHPAYRVSLLNPSNNQVLWRSGRIKPTGNRKALGVRFRAGLLKPQAYLLQVSGMPVSGRSEVIGDYPFRVVR